MTIKKRNIADIGEMDKQITIQGQGNLKTASGGRETVYNDLAQFTNIWAKVRDVGGVVTRTQGAHYTNIVNKVFTIIFHSDFKDLVGTPRNRIKWNGRRYKVQDIKNVGEADRYLELICDAFDVEVI